MTYPAATTFTTHGDAAFMAHHNASSLMARMPNPATAASIHRAPLRNPQAELILWERKLNPTDRLIVNTALQLYTMFPVLGACYHTSFFLHYYLKHQHGIHGRVEIGYINDTTDDRYASHAWYVHSGRITDLAISRPHDPQSNLKGPLTILGREITPGWKWTYHTETSHRGLQATTNLLTSPSADPHDIISGAKRTHILMSETARCDVAIRAYLDASPAGCTYLDLIEKIMAGSMAYAA